MTAVIIVGAGQAGFQAAASLREFGFEGTITLIGEETEIPYQRPPLSKAYLAGSMSAAALQLRPSTFFTARDIAILTGERVTRIERALGRVAVASGRLYPYDHLILATGARNRLLPGEGGLLAGVHYLRTLSDAAALKMRLDADVRHIVVLGAGFIGLEFAAVAAKRGSEVMVVEMADRPMARALSPAMSAFFRAAHEAMGVAFQFGARVARLEGSDGHVRHVVLEDGQALAADLVVVGIGVVPNTELAAEAGLAVSNGIEVDATLATADPAVSAIGDCAVHPSRFGPGVPLRIESVQNAIDQGRCVARRITGQPERYGAVPWFWSDQGPYKLQIVGIASPGDATVVRGDPSSGQFSVFCYAGEQLRAVESVNRAQDHMAARRFLAQHRGPTPAEAADTAFNLKAFAQRSA